MEGKYSLTIGFKILILQFILSFTGLIIGFGWGLNAENKKWSRLIYTDIKIGDINIGGKTKEEARKIIKDQYIDAIDDRILYVTVEDKAYSVKNYDLVKSYEIDSAINQAFNFGKDLKLIEKHELIKNGSKKIYPLDFTYNDDAVNTFTTNIEKDINKGPVNAVIQVDDKGEIKVRNEIKGHNLEKEQLNRYIEDKIKTEANKDIFIKAPVKILEPKVTRNALLSVNKCIGSFTTSFKSSSYMRANNIDVSVKSIDGKILMPGETFSFNDIVGERTKERGYMEAPVIVNNKFQLGVGGGICQVSTTLYNAVLKSGITNIERTGHSLPISYAREGFDAAVDFGNIDFKFQNTWNYPIYIQAYTESKDLHINIFSNSSINSKSV